MSVSSRDDILLNSRPLIKYSEISNKEFIIEDFQNKVLRPILKFQNDLFIQLFIKQLKSKKQLFKTFELEGRSLYICIYEFMSQAHDT